ncbi:MAG: hypothetical protein JW741_15180 [Sedimentisphaerales bacterium]|nr:hypothetical protein [Sedimentisphaerales bacterium]
MKTPITRDEDMSLTQETCAAIALVKVGLFMVQRMENVEHAQLAVLSNGLERMLKLIILLDFFAENRRFPELDEYEKTLKCKTHDLRSLLRDVVKIVEKQKDEEVREEASKDLHFLESPEGVLSNLLDIFSEYGRQGRYHDLNALVKANRSQSDPTLEFESLLGSKPATDIIEAIQKLARELCRIMHWRMGAKLADDMNQILGDFLYMKDADLSTVAFEGFPPPQGRNEA